MIIQNQKRGGQHNKRDKVGVLKFEKDQEENSCGEAQILMKRLKQIKNNPITAQDEELISAVKKCEKKLKQKMRKEYYESPNDMKITQKTLEKNKLIGQGCVEPVMQMRYERSDSSKRKILKQQQQQSQCILLSRSDTNINNKRQIDRLKKQVNQINVRYCEQEYKDEDRFLQKYGTKLKLKKKEVEILKIHVIDLEEQNKQLKIKLNYDKSRFVDMIDQLKQEKQALSTKIQSLLRENIQLKKQTQEFKLKNLAYSDELQKLIGEKETLNLTIEKNYNSLKEALQIRDKEIQSIRMRFEPHAIQQKQEKVFLQTKIIELECELRNSKEAKNNAQGELKLIQLQLQNMKEKNEEWQSKYSEKKLKYSELKKEFEKIRNEVIATTVMSKLYKDEPLTSPNLLNTNNNNNIQSNINSNTRKLKALETIKSLIKHFPK